MKYIGENAIKKLISLIKGDLATKQPTITASGLLKGDGAGTVTAADTQEATLVDVPNGLLKGDGTTISAAVAEMDYMVPPTGGITGQILKKTETGTEWADTKESFVITFSASGSGSDITYSCDKTYADILAAYNDGRPLMALIPVGNSTEKVHTSTYRFVHEFLNRVDFYAEIRGEDLDVEQATLLCAFVMESGLARVIETDMQPGIGTLGIVKGVPGQLTGYQYTSAEPNVDYMPPVPITAADNGKFLRVVNGAWAAATIENANGVSF